MKYLLTVTIAMSLFSCTSNEQKDSEGRRNLKQRVAGNSDSLDERTKYFLENTKVDFGTPIVLKSSKNIAVPVQLEEIYVEKEMPKYTYFNIAILDEEFKFKKYLFDKSVVIGSIETEEENVFDQDNYYEGDYKKPEMPEYNSLLIFDLWEFEKRKKDYRRIYVYDLNLDSLRQISIPNTHVLEWKTIPGKKAIYLKYQNDTNKDGVFDDKDDSNIVFVDLHDNSAASEIFDLLELKKLKLKVAIKNK